MTINFKKEHREALISKINNFLAMQNFQLNGEHRLPLHCDPNFTEGGKKGNKVESAVF